jgi:signal transduction histidine kinase
MRRWPGGVRSLRFRVLAVTLAALAAALLLSALALEALFRDHVRQQFVQTLTAQLDQLTARLAFDADGAPSIDRQALSDPRWQRPLSGLYWQLDGRQGAAASAAVLRSRSLWDATLDVEADALPDGAVHVHEVHGPIDGPGTNTPIGGPELNGALSGRLLLVERTVRRDDVAATPWRLLVAGDLQDVQQAVMRFRVQLLPSLAVLGALLASIAVLQVVFGLAPLRALQAALSDLHAGRARRLEGRFPAEVQGLIEDFNAVLDRNDDVVARARTQAGNLAHALKTPLTVLQQAAADRRAHASAVDAPDDLALAALVQEQVAAARRQIDWHLARARAAAAHGMPGAQVPVGPVVDGLLRVMVLVHAARQLHIDSGTIDPGLSFAGEAQDLQEMLGNVIDNACQWARQQVRVEATLGATTEGGSALLQLTVDDDGPGIDAERRSQVMARGARLDESVPGHGLGLAIVQELAQLYGGAVSLWPSPLGGLRVRLSLPGRHTPGRAPTRAPTHP